MNKYRAQSKAAHREYKKLRACIRKVRFDTADEARRKGQDIYQCKHCGGWHRSGSVYTLANTLLRKHARRLAKS